MGPWGSSVDDTVTQVGSGRDGRRRGTSSVVEMEGAVRYRTEESGRGRQGDLKSPRSGQTRWETKGVGAEGVSTVRVVYRRETLSNLRRNVGEDREEGRCVCPWVGVVQTNKECTSLSPPLVGETQKTLCFFLHTSPRTEVTTREPGSSQTEQSLDP